MRKQEHKMMHGMKKVLCGMAAVVLLVVSMVTEVRADVIWEPYEDDFYSEHYEECEHISADYLTNGKEGYVTAYKAPDSSKEVAKIMNGKAFSVSFAWQDKEGNTWGIIELNLFKPEEGESRAEDADFGWIPMTDMAKIYNGEDFFREHEAEFGQYQGELDDYKVQDKLIVWEYPGSEKIKSLVYGQMLENDIPAYEHLYTDADGNRWTYIGYYYGSHRGWICMDHPEAEELSVSYEIGETEEELYRAQVPGEGLGGTDVPGVGLAAGLVGGVVAVTMGLIAVLFGKKKSK